MNTTIISAFAKIAPAALILDHSIAIYVPATREGNIPLTAAEQLEQVERVAAILSGLFGGATATNGRGYWMSEKLGLVAEATVIVSASCAAEDLIEHLPDVLAEAQRLKDELTQEGISIMIDGTLAII